jgi:chloramphenicol 3-O-phosphotransferase
MISTALAIQDATKEAVMHDVTMFIARDIFDNKDVMDEKQFAKAMFKYSAHLSALTASLVMEACLTKSQLDEMMNTIKEMESMGKDLDNE